MRNARRAAMGLLAIFPRATTGHLVHHAAMGNARRVVESLGLALVLWLVGCGSSRPVANPEARTATTGGDSTTTSAQAQDPHDLVARGIALTESHRCAEAIRDGYEPAIAIYQRQVEPGTRVMATRGGPGSALLSLLLASGDGQSAVVMGPEWPDTLYLEAYCQVELGRMDLAAQTLQRALEMIPGDVAYACELGNILQEGHEWQRALELYRAGLDNVMTLARSTEYAPTAEAPEGPRVLGMTLSSWQRRALRGIGFSLIELHDLDGAERMFQQVLAIDPSDERAMGELRYIAQLRADGGGGPTITH
jgi:tetratricopeptide (TPR) repeat protein